MVRQLTAVGVTQGNGSNSFLAHSPKSGISSGRKISRFQSVYFEADLDEDSRDPPPAECRRPSSSILASKRRNYSGGYHVSEHEEQVRKHLFHEIADLLASKSRIEGEIEILKRQVQSLVSERARLIEDVEDYGHVPDLALELEQEQNDRRNLEEQLIKIRKNLAEAIAEKDSALEKVMNGELIREEMQKQMQLLYEEKISSTRKLEDKRVSEYTALTVPSTVYDEEVKKLQDEIDIIKVENESLRIAAKREAAARQVLRGEIKSLSAENFMMKQGITHYDDTRYAPACKKRSLFIGQGVNERSERNWEKKRSLTFDPRDRVWNGSSDNSISYESDNVSVLFGQDSIDGRTFDNPASIVSAESKSDHQGIRAHAERLLYWANRASERHKTSGSNSLARETSAALHQSVPDTIGLPPRSQSFATTNSRFPPPRPPQLSQEDGTIGTDRTGTSGSVGDKENGTSFNIVTEQKPKHVSVSESAFIYNLESIEKVNTCFCSASPFSGSDPHAELFLPKLGLACTCGQSPGVESREMFSENPTSLKNILRQWQCEFLQSVHIETAGQLLRAHQTEANQLARRMKRWREEKRMHPARCKECYIALQIWSRTAKIVMRSVQKQLDAGDLVIEKPRFLDISFADAHSVSTLGYGSSVGGRTCEMMEI